MIVLLIWQAIDLKSCLVERSTTVTLYIIDGISSFAGLKQLKSVSANNGFVSVKPQITGNP